MNYEIMRLNPLNQVSYFNVTSKKTKSEKEMKRLNPLNQVSYFND